MFESARAQSIRRAPHAPRLASAIERSAPLRENPAGSATYPRRPPRPTSRAESRAPSPAFAFRPVCQAPRPRTLPVSPDTAASSAPCPGPAARFALQEIPCVAFLPNAPSLLQKIDIFRLALRTNFRNLLDRSAIMAFQPVALLVMRHRNAAIHTLHRRAAAPAQDRPRVSAPVYQHQRLRPTRQTFLKSRTQRRGNRARLVLLLKIFAQVRDFHARERTLGNS